MKIIIHRGTHQIGGIATELSTENTRIIIDLGDELNRDSSGSVPINIDGVTNHNGTCDGVLLTHHHQDHVGQLRYINKEIPCYMGALTKEILTISSKQHDKEFQERIRGGNIFQPGIPFEIGDIKITPLMIDHSAVDSYMFVIEADGKRILYTGDFRKHGFRGKALEKVLKYYVNAVDLLLIEGTSLSRMNASCETEHELQRKFQQYIEAYKYVFVLTSTTNLERICGISKVTPRGKYFLCDEYQAQLLDCMKRHWENQSELYRNLKVVTWGPNLLPKVMKHGCVMMVRDNQKCRELINQFDKSQSIILYSMWDGYRTRDGNSIQNFLELAGNWETLHTSGHASISDLGMVIETCNPKQIIWMHTDAPQRAKELFPDKQHIYLGDKQEFCLGVPSMCPNPN